MDTETVLGPNTMEVMHTEKKCRKIENKSRRDSNMDTETVLGPNTMEVIHTEKKCRKNRE